MTTSKRLSPLEALGILNLERGDSIRHSVMSEKAQDAMFTRLVKRGFAVFKDGVLVVTEEGRAAFRRWEG